MKRRVAIVGTGWVGSSVAISTLHSGVADELLLHDLREDVAEGEAMDLAHGASFYPSATVRAVPASAIGESDVVVIAAGRGGRPGQSRLDLLRHNAEMVREIGRQLIGYEGTIVMVTNPVDVVTYAALKISGLPSNQLFGSGTVLDTSRLRYLVARETGVAVQNVHAYIAGEHGDSEIPLWSSAIIAAAPISDWRNPEGKGIHEADEQRIAEQVKNAAYSIIAGKGATNYAIGLAGARIIEAVLRDENAVLAVSSLITEYPEFGEVCMALPTVVNRHGAVSRILPPLSRSERAGLVASAQSIRATAAKFGY